MGKWEIADNNTFDFIFPTLIEINVQIINKKPHIQLISNFLRNLLQALSLSHEEENYQSNFSLGRLILSNLIDC